MPFGAATCLVVDGHDVIREGLRLVLAHSAAIRLVAEAADEERAVALAERLRPDVVLIDPALCGADLTALRQLRLVSPASRIVLFSRLADPQLVARGRAAGASGFVVKDSGAATIVRAVAAVRSGLEYVDPQLVADDLPHAV